MRATWLGARSGRIVMVTGPLEVSSSNVLSNSAVLVIGILRLLIFTRFNDRKNQQTSRGGAAEFLGDRQRSAAVEHVDHCTLIGHPHLRRHARRYESEARLAENLAVPVETVLHHHP